jgi:hypothetical protein
MSEHPFTNDELRGLRAWYKPDQTGAAAVRQSDNAAQDFPILLDMVECFRSLVEQALFLRMYGERPPGAPKDPAGETWRDWDTRAEAALRGDV